MSGEPGTIVAQLAGLAALLADVMEQETACLEQSRWDAVAAVGPEKSRLSLRYDTLMTELAAQSRTVIAADPSYKLLAESGRRLDRAARANAARLSIQIKANQRIAHIIAGAARNAASPMVSYGKTRTGFGARAHHTAPPVAVSQVY